jgi:hypothetical protein
MATDAADARIPRLERFIAALELAFVCGMLVPGIAFQAADDLVYQSLFPVSNEAIVLVLAAAGCGAALESIRQCLDRYDRTRKAASVLFWVCVSLVIVGPMLVFPFVVYGAVQEITHSGCETNPRPAYNRLIALGVPSSLVLVYVYRKLLRP